MEWNYISEKGHPKQGEDVWIAFINEWGLPEVRHGWSTGFHELNEFAYYFDSGVEIIYNRVYAWKEIETPDPPEVK